jgi:glutamate decarboxylase
VPAYTFPANREDLAVLRIVVRNGFSHDLLELFLADLERILPELEAQAAPAGSAPAGSFHH